MNIWVVFTGIVCVGSKVGRVVVVFNDERATLFIPYLLEIRRGREVWLKLSERGGDDWIERELVKTLSFGPNGCGEAVTSFGLMALFFWWWADTTDINARTHHTHSFFSGHSNSVQFLTIQKPRCLTPFP